MPPARPNISTGLRLGAVCLLKVGLSGIAKRYDYQTVQDFYRAYHTAKNVYADYQDKAAKWEGTYGTKVKRDTVHDRIQSYQRDESARQAKQTTHRNQFRDYVQYICCSRNYEKYQETRNPHYQKREKKGGSAAFL